MSQPTAWSSRVLCFLGLQLILATATLAAIEGILYVVDLRYLRVAAVGWEGMHYHYDKKLGWSPIASEELDIPPVPPDPRHPVRPDTRRPVHIANNSLGFRDIEYQRGEKPTILVIGDSLVEGTFVEAEERFTELLRRQLSAFSIVNAGVAGYGTDQEYLLLQQIWDHFEPSVVVLIFCTENDRRDNTRNLRYGTYKPYLAVQPNGSAHFAGIPVPKSKLVLYRQNWWTQHFALARAAAALYLEAVYRRVEVPDPSERLIGMMRHFVEERGAKFLVGVQQIDDKLIAYLREQGIAFASFEDAPDFTAQPQYGLKDFHWSPEGHVVVAENLLRLFREAGVLDDGTATSAKSQ